MPLHRRVSGLSGEYVPGSGAMLLRAWFRLMLLRVVLGSESVSDWVRVRARVRAFGFRISVRLG